MRSLTLAGLALALTPLGTATWAQSAPSYGTPVTFSDLVSEVQITRLDDERFVLGYVANQGRTQVGSLGADGAITLGPDFPFDAAADVEQVRIEALDASRFVVAYSRLDQAHAVVGEVSGLDVTYGPVVSLDADCEAGLDLEVLDSNRFVVVCSGNGTGRARVCSIAGAVVTLGATATFHSSPNLGPTAAALDASQFVVTFNEPGPTGYLCVGQASGTSAIAFGPVLPLPQPAFAVEALDGARFLVGLKPLLQGSVAVGTVTGSLVATLGPESEFLLGEISWNTYAFLEVIGEDRFVVSWHEGWIDFDGLCAFGACGYRSRKGVVEGDVVTSLSDAVLASAMQGSAVPSRFDHAQVGPSDGFVAAFVEPGSFQAWVCRSAPDGTCTFHNGSGLNPTGYTCLSAPLGGETWMASVDDTPSVGASTTATLIGFGLGGATSGALLPAGELLVLPPYVQHVAFGLHDLPLAPGIPAGITIESQAARIEMTASGEPIAVLLNGLELFIGG